MSDAIMYADLMESVLINLMVEEHDLQREEQGMPVLDEVGLEKLREWVYRLVSHLREEPISDMLIEEK